MCPGTTPLPLFWFTLSLLSERARENFPGKGEERRWVRVREKEGRRRLARVGDAMEGHKLGGLQSEIRNLQGISKDIDTAPLPSSRKTTRPVLDGTATALSNKN